jgi:hypothetical protein
MQTNTLTYQALVGPAGMVKARQITEAFGRDGYAVTRTGPNTVLQAIETRYFGPGNTRGARVKAICQARSITVHWDHALNPEANHRAAAEKLMAVMGWSGRLVQGGLPGDGYCFVQLVD